MAKGGNKLTKLKSVLKKMQSFKVGRINETLVLASNDEDSYSYDSHCSINYDQHTVYVGKSRRRYLVSSKVVYHPLFRELVQRSGNSEDSIAVANCEVVLFQHLLWMLQNTDPHQTDSFDELFEFYSC